MTTGATSAPGPQPSKGQWLAGVYILSCVGCFVVATGSLMLVYRGNNPFDPAATSYDFWRNTLCDLGKSDRYAPGAWLGPWLFTLAMAIIGSALGPLFWVLSAEFSGARWQRVAMRCLGVLAMAGAVGVGLTPADTMEAYHSAAIGSAAVPGLIAMVMAVWGIFRGRGGLEYKTMTALFLTFAIVHFIQYVRQLWLGHPWMQTTPMVQKLTIILAMAWFSWTAVRALRGGQKERAG